MRQVRADIAASFQRVAVTHLAERVARGAAWAKADFPDVKTLVVSGRIFAIFHFSFCKVCFFIFAFFSW